MNTKLPEDELVDIVDEHDRVLHTAWRSEASLRNLQYRRIVLAFILNKHGKIAILRRTADKDIAPSALALVGGGVQSGEDYDQACKREVAEEVGIDIDQHSVRLLDYRRPHDDNMGYFKKIYEIKIMQETITYNPQDFCELYWMTAPEFFERIKAGDTQATDLDLLVRLYYLST